ncbi:trigger factor, partial [Planctomycetota bacterium]
PSAGSFTSATSPSSAAAVEETGPCARLVRVEVSQTRIQEEIDSSYTELRQTVFIKGFRRGHVPRHVLEGRFGEDVLKAVKETLMDEGYQKALEEHSLKPALPPDVDQEAVSLDPTQPLSFEVKLEVAPDFTLDNYKGLAVQRPTLAVSEQDVEQALEAFRMRRGEFKVVEEAEVGENDVPVCHAVALVEGEEKWRREGLGAHIADETVGGIPVPGLRDALIGTKPGEAKILKVTLPAEFPEEGLAGKEVDLEVTVDEVRRFEVPEATDEWAKTLEFDGIEDLREEIEDELKQQRERDADEAVHRGLDDQLLELTAFDVPDGLVERMVEGAMERQRMGLLYRGVSEEDIAKLVAEQEQRTREGSIRQCKLYFIYLQIAEQEKLFVTEAEIEQRVQAIALNYGRRPDEVKADLEESGRLGSLRMQMREEQVRDFLVQHAEITEVEAPSPAAEPEAAGDPEADAPAPDDDSASDDS